MENPCAKINQNPAEYVKHLRASFAEACARADGTYKKAFSLGPRVVEFHMAGAGLERRLTQGVAHLEVPGATAAQLSVAMWDAGSLEDHWAPQVAVEPGAPVTETRCYYALLHERYQYCFSYTSEGTFYSFIDHETGEAFYWTPDSARMPSYEYAAPIRLILHWWLRRAGAYLVHAAVIGTDEGGVLFGGRGGSGKSTTALHCARGGLTFLGDDYVAVSAEQLTAWSLYNSGKLDRGSLERLPDIAPLIHYPITATSDKAIVFLHGDSRAKLRTSLPLRAIVLPKIRRGESSCKLVPTSRIAALARLGPSTMLQMPGTTSAEFEVIGRLAKSLPCYELELGSDISRVPDLLSDLIRSLRPEQVAQ